MEHLFLYRMQEHELTMRQMVEEINQGSLNILQAAAKYQVNRSRVNDGSPRLKMKSNKEYPLALKKRLKQ